MAGQRSVRRRPWPSLSTPYPGFGLLLAFLTLFATALPNSAAARPDAVRSTIAQAQATSATAPRGAPATRQSGPDAHAVARSVERRLAAAVAGAEDDDADETPRDVQRVRPQPGLPGLLARAVLPDPCPAGVPAPSGHGQRRTAANETPPESVFRCNPDGRGPPRRR